MLESSYSAQPSGSGSLTASSGQSGGKDAGYWDISKLKRCYTDYLFSKREEIDEQIDARRYYHGSQWTEEQIKALKRRKQPIMTFNRVARKIDGVVGLIEKLRQDPKAYARTPQHEEGADLATASIRYVLDEQEWKAKSPQAAQDGAVDGIGGVELEIEEGDQGDKEIGFELVDIQSFFYDPRSYQMDFSDARYMGIGKWLDEDVAKEMFPDAPDSAFTSDAELLLATDREKRWFRLNGVIKQIRIVDIWYKHKGGWCWAIFSGNSILMEGKSYFQDEKKKDFCKYVMFSGNVDQDGDRYGFVRNMKSAQDGINAKQSKMQHMIASKRIFIRQGGVEDVEKTRAEMMRTDGVVVVHGAVNESVKADDQSFDFAGMDKLLERNINEIEMFGPNPQLVGQADGAQSGKAIALLQQAGMAELGPFILAYRSWKIRLYRGILNAIQKHWTGERWIRVTDDQNLAQFVKINGMQVGPDGQPTMVNAIGSLDVDVIMDEGPDAISSMQDMYETLSNILPSIAPVLTPQKASLVVDTLIETSPLDSAIKKRFKDQSEQAAQQPPQPDPAVMAAEAKAQIDLKAKADAAQLENQRAMDANAFKRQSNAIDLEHKEKTANLDLEAKTVAHKMELGHEHEKNKAAIEHETHKANVGLNAKKEESNIRQGEMKAKADNESSVHAAKNKPQQDHSDALKTIAESLKTSMEAVAESVTAKKSIKVERDKAGRIVGATVDA